MLISTRWPLFDVESWCCLELKVLDNILENLLLNFFTGSWKNTPTMTMCMSSSRCGVLRPQLHAQPEPYAEAERCEVGACPE